MRGAGVGGGSRRRAAGPKAPWSARMMASGWRTASAATPAQRHLGLDALPVSQIHQHDRLARLVGPEGVGHVVQVLDWGVAQLDQDVAAPEPRLLGRTAGAYAGDPDSAGRLRHVRNGAEVSAIAPAPRDPRRRRPDPRGRGP